MPPSHSEPTSYDQATETAPLSNASSTVSWETFDDMNDIRKETTYTNLCERKSNLKRDIKDAMERLEAWQKESRENIELLKNEVAGLKRDNQDLQGRVTALEGENQDLRNEIADLKHDNKILRERIVVLEEDNETWRNYANRLADIVATGPEL